MTSEIIFDLFGSSYYDDLVFTGFRSGNANPYDIANARLEGSPIVPIPSAIWLLGFGVIGLAGLRRKFSGKNTKLTNRL